MLYAYGDLFDYVFRSAVPKKIGPQAQILAARAENSCRVNGPLIVIRY